MYKFRVYHRNAVKEDPETGKLVLDRNPLKSALGASVGHSIVALYDGTTERARGLYPNNKYKNEAKSIKDAKEYQEEHPNEKVFYVIEFDITKEQYEGAWNVMKKFEPYVGKNIPKEVLDGMYIILGNNCADFTNTVYRGTGLPGNFTDQMTTPQLDKIPGAVELYVKTLGGFGIGDKSRTVLGKSVKEVAEKYNVPESRVSQREAIQGIPDADLAIEQDAANQFSFVIAPNPKLVASAASQEFLSTLMALSLHPSFLKQVEERNVMDSEDAWRKAGDAAIQAAMARIEETEKTSKVKSIIEAALKAFKEKFEAIRDKFTKKLKDDIEKTAKDASDSQQNGQAEYDAKAQAIHQQKAQEIEAMRGQLQSSYESQVAAIAERKKGEIDAFFQQGQAECDAVFAARSGAASNQPSSSLLTLSYVVSNSDVVAQKNAELSTFKAQKSAEMEAEQQALLAQTQNQLSSFIASKEAEAAQQCNALKSSIEQRLKSKESKIKEIAEAAQTKQTAQVEKCNRKIKDIQEDTTGLIERLKEVVGNSGDAEAVIN